ncbi:MAG: flagellar brake protein [Gammaproteobacteria bacterium]
MATELDYIVKNAKMVFKHFNELVTNKCLISAHFGDRNASFLTTIIDLDEKQKTINLDCAPSDNLDQQLLSSDKVLFRTELEGIKVSFSGKGIKKINTDGEWVLSMPIPDSIFWMQRRQFYRVKIPLSHNNSYCKLTFRIDDEEITESFRLYDLSIAGFSLLNPNPKWAEQLQPGAEFADCTLRLHNGNQGYVSFVVKNNVQIRSSPLAVQDKIGCLFHPLTPSFESNVQRYMQDIELQQKK